MYVVAHLHYRLVVTADQLTGLCDVTGLELTPARLSLPGPAFSASGRPPARMTDGFLREQRL